MRFWISSNRSLDGDKRGLDEAGLALDRGVF